MNSSEDLKSFAQSDTANKVAEIGLNSDKLTRGSAFMMIIVSYFLSLAASAVSSFSHIWMAQQFSVYEDCSYSFSSGLI